MSGGWWVSVGSLGSSVGEAGGLGGQVVLEVRWSCGSRWSWGE